MNEKPEMKFLLDEKSDVLYISFGDPQEALSVEMFRGIFVRVNPETDEVVGVTIVKARDFLASQGGAWPPRILIEKIVLEPRG